MGLSSSQGRLLMLTARLSDIQLQQTMISQQRNALATKSEDAAKVYNEAMNNYKLQIKVTDPSEEKGYQTQKLNYKNMTQMGYLATTAQNQVMLEKDEDGNWIIPKDIDGKDLLKIDDKTGKAVINNKKYDLLDGTNYLSDENMLQDAIKNGVMFIFNVNDAKEGISISNLESNTEMEYVLDTSDDAEALSKYEYESARISRDDNQLDLDLKQLETQQTAINKEYESVKEVIKSNVDRTFSLFSNG